MEWGKSTNRKQGKLKRRQDGAMQTITVIALISVVLNIVLLIWGMVQKIGLCATTWILIEKQVEFNANDMRKAQEKVIKRLLRIKN